VHHPSASVDSDPCLLCRLFPLTGGLLIDSFLSSSFFTLLVALPDSSEFFLFSPSSREKQLSADRLATFSSLPLWLFRGRSGQLFSNPECGDGFLFNSLPRCFLFLEISPSRHGIYVPFLSPLFPAHFREDFLFLSFFSCLLASRFGRDWC